MLYNKFLKIFLIILLSTAVYGQVRLIPERSIAFGKIDPTETDTTGWRLRDMYPNGIGLKSWNDTRYLMWNAERFMARSNGTNNVPAFSNLTGSGFYFPSDGSFAFTSNGGSNYMLNYNYHSTGAFVLPSNGSYNWSSTATGFGTIDLTLDRAAADILEQKRGANPQNYRLWSKDGTGTNDRYADMGWGTGADSLKYKTTETHSGGKAQGSWNATGFSGYIFDAPTGNTAQQTITLGASATTFAVTKNVTTVTGDAGANTVATITGAVVGIYTFIFVDALVTITDDDTHAANSVDLAGTATNFTSADDKTLTLVFDGTSWYQLSTSAN